MHQHNLEDMVRGFFVGNFDITAFKTDACEVAVKKFKKGDEEPVHYHKVATEITLILEGQVKMHGQVFFSPAIITTNPMEKTSFLSVTDSVLVVVKVPGILNDKYLS